MKKHVSFDEFVTLCCEKNFAAPSDICELLRTHRRKSQPRGWFIARCKSLETSVCIGKVIMPFGDNNPFKSPPEQPFARPAVGNRAFVVEAVLLDEDIPESVKA